MSAPTEMELRRPEPESDISWACKVDGCREIPPAYVEDQPHCEACHVPVCDKHVVTRAHVHLCPGCAKKQRDVMIRVAVEMVDVSTKIIRYLYRTDPNEVQSACERWMKEIGEVL